MNNGFEPYLGTEEGLLVDYLHGLYAGAFPEESIRAHLNNYVGFDFAQYTTEVLRARLPVGASILDIGCGFGSTVILAREARFDARGVEIAPFEVEFARRRLARIRPEDDPDQVFLLGDATRLEQPDASLDAVAFWNVLEHIEQSDDMLQSAWRMLKPGGLAIIECPNYAADRQEAHYHVPWKAEMRHDRAKASDYLRSLGRDPTYFERSIFCRTNAEILGIVKKLGFKAQELGTGLPMDLSPRNFSTMVKYPLRFLGFHNPRRHSVILSAQKPLRS